MKRFGQLILRAKAVRGAVGGDSCAPRREDGGCWRAGNSPRKREETDRLNLRSMAPALDPSDTQNPVQLFGRAFSRDDAGALIPLIKATGNFRSSSPTASERAPRALLLGNSSPVSTLIQCCGADDCKRMSVFRQKPFWLAALNG